jgi:hypothetical protein
MCLGEAKVSSPFDAPQPQTERRGICALQRQMKSILHQIDREIDEVEGKEWEGRRGQMSNRFSVCCVLHAGFIVRSIEACVRSFLELNQPRTLALRSQKSKSGTD